jgi:hypothetical protein
MDVIIAIISIGWMILLIIALAIGALLQTWIWRPKKPPEDHTF